MKGNILTVAAIVIASNMQAQITIDQWDVIQPGYTQVYDIDTMPSVSMPSIGANQIWDYSGLTMHETHTIEFGAPGWFANGAAFPTATLAYADPDGIEIYSRNDANGYSLIGVAGDLFGLGLGGNHQVSFVPDGNMSRQYPMNYGNSWSDIGGYDAYFSGADAGSAIYDSVRLHRVSYINTEIVGWGTITTPYGTFEVLQSEMETTHIDSLYTKNGGAWSLFDNSTEIDFNMSFKSNDPAAKDEVLSIVHDGAGSVLNAAWINGMATMDLYESLLSSNQTVYPNPTNGIINIDIEEGLEGEIVISSLNGSIAYSSSFIKQTINLSHLENGVYFYQIITEDYQKNGRIVLEK